MTKRNKDALSAFVKYKNLNMKKTFFIAAMIALTACGGNTVNKPAETTATTPTEQKQGIEAIEDGWRKTPIKVNNGGDNPTVTQLLKAFNTVWPTSAANTIIATAGDKDFFVEEWYEGESPVFVDNVDYCCAWYNHGDTGNQNIEARTYQREDGHTLFAVRVEQNNPEHRLFCCFYDYYPATQTIMPEDEPYKDLKRKWQNSFFNYYLGEKFDQTVIVEEVSRNDEGSCFHHYAWNGMKHEFHHSGEESYDPETDYEDETHDEIEVAPDEYWTEEAVAARIKEYFEAVNRTFAEGSTLEPLDLDEHFYTIYWNEVYLAVLAKDNAQESAEKMFFVDDNHWTGGLEPPIVVESIDVKLLTGNMAEATVALAEKQSGFRKKVNLSLDYQRGMWCINNWFEESHDYDYSGSILDMMEKYAGY